MDKFYLSQSALKDLEREDGCPEKWYRTWVTKEIKTVATEPMLYGSYGEYLCLGAGAPGTTSVTDLPRLKNGEKSAVQLRIEEQAERFRALIVDEQSPEWLGYRILNKQIPLKSEDTSGAVDFDAVHVATGGIWIIDLKFTGDMTRNWGDLFNKDFIQLTHYRDLYASTFNLVPSVGLLVMDFSPKKELKFIELSISKQKIYEKDSRFNAAREAIELYNQHGWTKLPRQSECSSCPLQCDKRMTPSSVVFEKIPY